MKYCCSCVGKQWKLMDIRIGSFLECKKRKSLNQNDAK